MGYIFTFPNTRETRTAFKLFLSFLLRSNAFGSKRHSDYPMTYNYDY